MSEWGSLNAVPINAGKISRPAMPRMFWTPRPIAPGIGTRSSIPTSKTGAVRAEPEVSSDLRAMRAPRQSREDDTGGGDGIVRR